MWYPVHNFSGTRLHLPKLGRVETSSCVNPQCGATMNTILMLVGYRYWVCTTSANSSVWKRCKDQHQTKWVYVNGKGRCIITSYKMLLNLIKLAPGESKKHTAEETWGTEKIIRFSFKILLILTWLRPTTSWGTPSLWAGMPGMLPPRMSTS